MNEEKLVHRMEQFNKALVALEEVAQLENDGRNVARDATIQRLEDQKLRENILKEGIGVKF